MKHILILFTLTFAFTFCQAQYTKESLTKILTSGSVRSWKGEDVTYAFNKNQTCTVNGKSQSWSLTSTDNVRWFLKIGDNSYELIVNYDKSGKEYLKLVMKTNIGFKELLLYPV